MAIGAIRKLYIPHEGRIAIRIALLNEFYKSGIPDVDPLLLREVMGWSGNPEPYTALKMEDETLSDSVPLFLIALSFQKQNFNLPQKGAHAQ